MSKTRIPILHALCVFLLLGCVQKNKTIFTEADINIIPKPVALQLNTGTFVFDRETRFVVGKEVEAGIAGILTDKFKKAAGWDLRIVDKAPSDNYVQLVVDHGLNSEAYRLKSTDAAVVITASEKKGFIYGLETLRQLLPLQIENQSRVDDVKWEIPNVEIQDNPRFKWRGLMLDVSRHFFDKEYVKKTIDRLAFLKMNTLHLHLVDDQGWRIEIKKYPKLTEVGGFRVDHEDKHWNSRPTPEIGEEATYGGFYTQEDIKEIVSYANSRGVTVVPEIEMPAHVMSAIAAYPELSCFETPIIMPSGGVWPITEIYCAGKESTFEFMENVLTEVMELFPSTYIHVGGDEATKTNWKMCPHCQKRIKDEGLKNVEELQSYFIKRMERFISSKGRVLMGWDEILEGGLASGATVMSWRGVKGGLEASAEGHDVVMTPGSHCYFNLYQGPQDTEPLAFGGYLPLSKVYEFDPVVDSMSQKQVQHVLGGQANLWSEYIPTAADSEYMLFPRLAALSEAVWTPKEGKDWNGFSRRIQNMFSRFAAMGIDYARSAYSIAANTTVDLADRKVSLSLKNEFPDSDIRYVIGEEEVDSNAIAYTKPIHIDTTTTIKAALFMKDKPMGNVFQKTFNYHKAVGKKVVYKEKYSNSYQGTGEYSLVNVLRGTKNFHEGQWQAWLDTDMELTLDLGENIEIEKVTVGSMENQGPDIYFPIRIAVEISEKGTDFKVVGTIERPYKESGYPALKDFEIAFDKQRARYVKVIAKNLPNSPKRGGSWLFVDEVLVE